MKHSLFQFALSAMFSLSPLIAGGEGQPTAGDSRLVEVARFMMDAKTIKPGYEEKFMRPLADVVETSVRSWLDYTLEAQRHGEYPFRLARDRGEIRFVARVGFVGAQDWRGGNYDPEDLRVFASMSFRGVPEPSYRYAISRAIGLFDTRKTPGSVVDSLSDIILENIALISSWREPVDLGYLVIYPMIQIERNGEEEMMVPWKESFRLKGYIERFPSGKNNIVLYMVK